MKGLNSTIPDARELFLCTVFAGLVFLSSCAGYNGYTGYNVPRESLPPSGPAIMEASPWAVVVGSGTTHIVFVKVMDRDRRPIPNQTVSANVENPCVATIEEHGSTDEKGLARFTVTGIGMPWYSQITFATDSISTKIYVWKRGWGPFWNR